MSKPYGPFVYSVLIFLSIFLPLIFSFYLIYKKRKEEILKDRVKQLDLFLRISWITFSMILLVLIVMIKNYNIKMLAFLQVIASLPFVITIFLAMRFYGFLSPSIEAFGEDLFNQAKDGIIILNSKGRITEVNKAAREYLDLGDTYLEGIKVEEVIKEYSSFGTEDEFMIKKGEKIFNIRKIPLSINERIIGTALLIVDITEMENLKRELITLNEKLQQKVEEKTKVLIDTIKELKIQMEARTEAEKELNRIIVLYKTLFDSGSDAIFLHNPDGYILDVNSKAYTLTGLEKEEMLGKSIVDIIKFSKDYKEFLSDRTQRDKDLIIEGVIPSKEGDTIYIEANISYTDIEGKEAFIVFVRDITQRKKMESQILNISKLESLSIFAGGVAHDFNNLLTAIFGNLSIAKLYIDRNSKAFKKIETIERVLEEAKALTSQLLSLSKGGEPIKKVTTIRDLLIDITNFTLRGSGIKPIFHIEGDLPPVKVDRTQISRIIQNILINAIEALSGKDEKKIEVITKKTRIPPSMSKFIEKDEVLEIMIKDNGSGIPEEILSHIFDPFFTTKEKGTGLGLAVSYSIIRKHGGHISVTSTPGKGTTFHIYIPVASETYEEEREPVINSETEILSGLKILIMDDEEAIRDFLYDALTSKGCKVDVAKEGSEAIEKYKEALSKGEKFDLVILDLTVPGGMGGKGVIMKLRDIDPDVCAIVSSGYSDTDVVSKYKEYGFVDYLNKPYTLSLLYSTIAKIVQEKNIIH